MSETNQPKPIPDPPDFPVILENPDDAQLQWEYDTTHSTGPAPLLEFQAFWKTAFEGWSSANESLGIPLRIRATRLNTYFYIAILPAVAPEEMPEAMNKAEETLNGQINRLESLWKEEWLPEITGHLAFWDAFDLSGAEMSALMDHLDETLDRFLELFTIHFVIISPVYVAMSQFDDLYRDLFGSEGALDSYRLLQGLDNETVITDRALWTLSRKALKSSEIRQAIATHAASEIPTALGAFPAGQAFWSEFQVFLEERGQRSTFWSISDESWIENPESPLMSLKEYLAQPDRDMDAERETLVSDREKAIAEARDRLKGYPRQAAAEFERLLVAAKVATVLTEDHGFWIDFASSYRLRRVLMEVGRRFADADALKVAEDVFHLTVEEIRGTGRDAETADLREKVVQRSNEIRQWEAVSPPPMLGTDFGVPPEDFFMRAMGKFLGAPPEVSEDPKILKGHPGSRGKVTARARLLKSPADSEKLHPGEVLVAQTTAPPWTPLFATAGAIVTDSGGVLSHCAVVAREYGIPAVVGTVRATELIQDGQILEVDGDAGVVRIIADNEPG